MSRGTQAEAFRLANKLPTSFQVGSGTAVSHRRAEGSVRGHEQTAVIRNAIALARRSAIPTQRTGTVTLVDKTGAPLKISLAG